MTGSDIGGLPVAATVQAWSTQTVAKGYRLSYWTDVASRAFVGLEFDAPAREDFSGSLRSRYIGEVGIALVEGDPLSVARTQSTLTAQPSDFLIAGLQLEGRCIASQNGFTRVLTPDALAVVDTSLPYRFLFESRFRQIVIRMPPIPAASSGGSSRLLALPGSATFLLRKLSIELLDPELSISEEEQAGIAAAIVHLMGAALQPRRAGLPPVKNTNYGAARHLIDQGFAQASYQARELAASLGISVRTLSRAFATHGTTIQGALWERRLLAARDSLLDPRWAGAPITDIAFSCGFNDTAHFSRRFRKRFGISPAKFRLTHCS